MPIIVWTRRATANLATALARTVGGGATAAETVAALRPRLDAAFPDADELVVVDHFTGFKHRLHEHILKVDHRGRGGETTFVVKLAPAEKLGRELAAWNACGLGAAGPVFMPLSDRHGAALAYQDAADHIGAAEAVWLEQATARAVRFDSPAADSVRQCLLDLFTQLDVRLYSRARPEPATPDLALMPRKGGGFHTLRDLVPAWNAGTSLALRRRLHGQLPHNERFTDPVDAAAALDAARLPPLLRGLAHGDLHGRNVIVGVDDQERAVFPSLFDYDSIRADNLVIWDFAELETELAIRILPKVVREDWVRGAAAFMAGQPATPEQQRLLDLLEAIRGEALRVLRRFHAAEADAQRELHFVRMAYALATVRYDNQTDREREAAYLLAGAAAAALQRLGVLATGPAYATAFNELHAANRSKDAAALAAAEPRWRALLGRHPASLVCGYELAFNLVNQGRTADAWKHLADLERDFDGHLDADTRSLWGRTHKEAGHAHLAAGQTAKRPLQVAEYRAALEAYREAAKHYRQAMHLGGDYFPLINVATLEFLGAALAAQLGDAAESASKLELARGRARHFCDHYDEYPAATGAENVIWKQATEAEARLLLGTPEEIECAAALYAKALARDGVRPHHAAAMAGQVRRILAGYALLGPPPDATPLRAVPQFHSQLD